MRLIAHIIKHGQWDCGYDTQKTWPGKERLGLWRMFYDAQYHNVLHVGPFWISLVY